MDQQQRSGWRPTRRHVLWAGSIIGVVALLLLIRLGYAHRWTGFGQYNVNGEVQPFKSLWDWLDLLIIPIVLALGGYLFTRSENRATRVAGEQRAQDEALQAYLDQMGQMLLDNERPLRRTQKGDEEPRTLARARTLTVLSRLDGERKRSVLQFLYEAGLIDKDYRVVDLRGADLRKADLSYTNLSGADLNEVDLSEADLTGADLGGAELRLAKLIGALVSGAYLSGVDLAAADLSEADLRDVEGVTDEKLEQYAYSLKGATMPDGQKYEEWLKSRGEDGKNSGPS